MARPACAGRRRGHGSSRWSVLASPERHGLGEAAALFGRLVGIQVGMVVLHEPPPGRHEPLLGAVRREREPPQELRRLLRERLGTPPRRACGPYVGLTPALGDAEPPAE